MRKDRRTEKGKRSRRNRVFARLEPLEARVLLAADFGAVGTGTANWSNLSNIPESPVGAVSYLQLEVVSWDLTFLIVYELNFPSFSCVGYLRLTSLLGLG